MDLNYLFKRQQVENSRARTAKSDAARRIHGELAHRYEQEIERITGGAIQFHNASSATFLEASSASSA